MTNPFARFVHTSPLSSLPHDPPLSLASNCIRDSFGPTVQLVADALQARGGASTLPQLIATIQSKSRGKVRTEERKQLLHASEMRPLANTMTDLTENGTPTTPSIRAALLVLLQHSMVKVTKKTISAASTSNNATSHNKRNKPRVMYYYEFQIDRARLLPRYSRYVEYTKKALDETAAALVEELLVQGRMKTIPAIVATVEQLHASSSTSSSTTIRNDRYTYRQAVLESFRRLVGGGFIQRVPELKDDEPIDEEYEFQDIQPPSAKKPKLSATSITTDDQDRCDPDDDPAVVTLLQGGPYKILPKNAVWRVNVPMYHDSLRAVSLGWLVSERYGGNKGSLVTAALKLAAHKQHAQSNTSSNNNSAAADFDHIGSFTAEAITRYLPKTVLQIWEKKPMGILPSLHVALVELSRCNSPRVLEELEVAPEHPEHAKFQVSTRKLVHYLQDRIIHQVVFDSHGEVAARICSILRAKGYLESDAIAEAAMVPAKDTREVRVNCYYKSFLQSFRCLVLGRTQLSSFRNRYILTDICLRFGDLDHGMLKQN